MTDVREPTLRLTPGSARGWFGGRALFATEPAEEHAALSLAEAAAALEAVFDGRSAGLAAAIARYDGACTLVRFASVAEAESPALAPPAPQVAPAAALPLLTAVERDLPGRAYRAAVRAVRERIAAGDVYVLNLTARILGELALEPADAFAALHARAAADFSAFAQGWPGDVPWLASVSPERFLRVSLGEGGARLVEVCPIKGTRARGATPAEDAAGADALAGDLKERAEHVMVVDLERNDLGVACAPGTVHVEPLREIATTPYCHQMVSTVRGTLRADATFAELLAATFPCGSVTGAPKLAAVRIAAELEATPRGAYCGSLLIARRGELDSSVLIRTLEPAAAAAARPRARWGTGCGITFDSDPAAEHLETLLKASPVLGDGAPPVALRETMRAVTAEGATPPRHVPLLDRHLARLAEGGCGPSVLARVRSHVAARLAETPIAPALAAVSARISVTVTPDGAVESSLSSEPSSLAVEGGIRYAVVEVARPPALGTSSAAKPAARRYWDRAHSAARLRGADQAVIALADGTVVDGSTASVWIVADGALVTPPAPPAVAGVMREVVFDIAGELGVESVERRVTVAELDAAREVFFTNAYGGVVPARGRGGALSSRIAEETGRVLGG